MPGNKRCHNILYLSSGYLKKKKKKNEVQMN